MTQVCVELWCEQSLCETAVWALSLSKFSMFQRISALAQIIGGGPCYIPSTVQLPGVTLDMSIGALCDWFRLLL